MVRIAQGIFGILRSYLVKSNLLWSHRLAVRTPGFHPGNRGSIPLGITTFPSIYYLSLRYLQ